MTPLVIGGSMSQLLCYDALKVVMAEILKCLPRACIWRPTGPQLVVLLLGGVVKIFREWSLLRESGSLGEETGILRHNPTSLHRSLPFSLPPDYQHNVTSCLTFPLGWSQPPCHTATPALPLTMIKSKLSFLELCQAVLPQQHTLG